MHTPAQGSSRGDIILRDFEFAGWRYPLTFGVWSEIAGESLYYPGDGFNGLMPLAGANVFSAKRGWELRGYDS